MTATAPDRKRPALGALGAAWFLATAVTAVQAQSAPAPRIFQCVLPDGRKVTSDKPIAECSTQGRNQRELNKDGSEKAIVEPPPTEDEKAERERIRQKQDAERKEREIAARSDRDLMKRYPDEAAHGKGREKALDDVRSSVRNSEARIKLLQQERRPLTDEAEFYRNKSMPAKLKAQLDANDAALDAQKSLVQNQEIEIARISGRYDRELARLRRLWDGALPGSLGPPGARDLQPAPTKAASK